MGDQTPPSRRSILATALTGATAGCIGPLSDGPSCALSTDFEIEHEAIYLHTIAHTSNNDSEGGSCNRWTAKRCFVANFVINADVIDRIEGQTPEGELVAVWDANDVSNSGQSTTVDRKRTPNATESVFEGFTRTPSSDDNSRGTVAPDDAPGVYLQLAVIGRGETVTRNVLFFSDGEQIEKAELSLDC